MLQTVEETPSHPPAANLQRSALRDLVVLSTECTAKEAEIDRQYEQSLAAAKKACDTQAARVQHAFEHRRNEVEGRYQEHADRTEKHFRSEMKKLTDELDIARRNAEHDFDVVENDVRQQFEQARWLADSMLEAAEIQLREENKKADKQYESQAEALEAMEKQVRELMESYGYDALPVPAEEDPPAEEADPAGAWERHRLAAEQHLAVLRSLWLPRMFVGFLPYLVMLVVLVIVAGGTQMVLKSTELRTGPIAIAIAVALVVCVAAGFGLKAVSRSQVLQAYVPVRRELKAAGRSAKKQQQAFSQGAHEHFIQAQTRHKEEIKSAKEKFSPQRTSAQRRRDSALGAAEADHAHKRSAAEHHRDRFNQQTTEWRQRSLAELEQARDQEIRGAHVQYHLAVAEIEKRYEQEKADLEARWSEGLRSIQAPIETTSHSNGKAPLDWNDPAWKHWRPPSEFTSKVRFGELSVDLSQISNIVPRRLTLPESFSVPAAMAFPNQSSLMIQTDLRGRSAAVQAVQMIMARLLTSLPAGRARFTIIDPVGLGQNFAGFMHLADHDEALVGGRIWTEAEHIEQRLLNLTEHMETVIQKYLRNEFATIDEYNAQAGELAEPYRFLVVADFPTGFSGDTYRRLASIATTGARCGVYTIIIRDTRQTLPADAHLDELEAASVNLVRDGDRFVWKDEVFRRFPLELDPPPSEGVLTQILDVVGRHAKESKRVEVPFETIAPRPGEFWSRSSKDDLEVPVGRLGATRLQTVRLGRGVAQHGLIAGKTGSGKSTLLHALITNLAMWYSPDEVEFYLVDFKKGVEFKTYATRELPHARAIAVESDREFGLSVLHRIDGELARRGEMFRRAGVQDLASYRDQTGQMLPRTLLIIDEFQEFFSEDDKLAQDAALLLDRLVRQGRAFGIHVLLGSQTIGGTSGLSRSTIGQMAVRIALQTSEADSQLILGDNNSAARLLSRPGEAIYNDQGGLVEANSPFQVAWLPDEQRDAYLQKVQQLAKEKMPAGEPASVFEGNAPADINKNRALMELLDAPTWPGGPSARAFVGDPVAIKDPTAITFRRQSGSNVMVIGQQEESAMAIFLAIMASLAGQQSPKQAIFYLLNGSAADSSLAGVLERMKETLPHPSRIVEYRAVPDAMNDLAKEMQRRLAEDVADVPSIYVMIYGLQRYRALRKQEESFSFSTGDEEKPPQPDKQFAELLRDGPAVGIHTVAWVDTAVAIERTLDRVLMREFDNRILFQMSANDSSNLIDSPLANKLGFYRALAYSEEQGTMEKFRPYALVDRAWLDAVKARLARKTS